MTSPLYDALKEVGVSQIYNEDGSVNFDVIEGCITNLDRSIGTEDEPTDISTSLGSIATNLYAFDLPLGHTKRPKTLTEKDSEIADERDPISHAIYEYIGHILFRNMEFDLSIGDINPQLKENPGHEPQFTDEMTRYFDFLGQKQSIRYQSLLHVHEQLTPPQTPVSELKCVVAIPVAGHQEHQNIYRTLEQFSKQDLDPESFEVFLYLNLPADDKQDNESLVMEAKKTLREIERFRASYPTVNIRDVTIAYHGDKPLIGKIRSDLWDLIAYDLTQRGRQDDILVISSDADIVNLNSTYLRGMYDTWRFSGADIVTAHLQWQSVPGLPYDAVVNRLLRYQTFVDNLRDNYAPTLHTADANTGVSLAMYTAVGGYYRQAQLGEMRGLVNRIRSYRNTNEDAEHYKPAKTVEVKSKTSYLKTHSRRLVKAISLGRAPYEAWNQEVIIFGHNDALRTEAMESDQAEYQASLNWKKWLKRDTPAYTYDVPLAKKRRVLKKARQLLGFQDLYQD